MKKIGAITMVRNDEFFLRRWVDYYGRELGKENLYILFDGEDQTIPDFCEGTHAELHPRLAGMVEKSEKSRLALLSQRAGKLMTEQGYDMMIGVDADEFVVVDPAEGVTLREKLSSLPKRDTWSPLGVDMAQNLNCEEVLDGSRPMLEQREYGWLCSRYTKQSIITAPVQWGSGFHRVRHRDFRIVPGLYLLHFGSIDLEMIKQRMGDRDLLSTGRGRHIMKRARSITIVSEAKPRNFDKWVPRVRRMQSVLRQWLTPNKPATYGFKCTVKLPSRFKKTGI